MNRKYKFIFFGEDAFSLAVLESLMDCHLDVYPIMTVMLEPITISGQRLAEYCESRGILLVKTTSVRAEEFLAQLEKLDYDLVVCAHFQRILPPRIFNKASLGALNLHPSLLPKYRGMAPQHWPIVLGELHTGVTVHRIDEDVDTGRIMQQVRIPLDPDIYIHELQIKFLAVYRYIMIEAVKGLIYGEQGQAQQIENASYFHKIKESDMEINTQMDVRHAYALVRAFSFPYRGVKFNNIRIMRAKPVNSDLWIDLQKNSTKINGLFIKETNRFLILKNGALELTKWRSV